MEPRIIDGDIEAVATRTKEDYDALLSSYCAVWDDLDDAEAALQFWQVISVLQAVLLFLLSMLNT